MEILYVRGCPYEDNEGEVLNLHIRLDEGDVLTEGGNIRIEMMDDSVIEREVKIINPKWAGDYAAVCEEAKQWKQSGETLKEIKGPGEWDIVVMHVPYHEVKTEEEIRNRAAMDEFLEDLNSKVCISPFKELNAGEKSIHDFVVEGYSVPDKVIAYLQTTNSHMMSLGLYEHPFKPGITLCGPYTYTDGYYYWDRDTWKYVLKYHVTLPQEFIDHVMSDAGTEFLEEQAKNNNSWVDRIKDLKEQEGTLCLLPEDAGNIEVDDF